LKFQAFFLVSLTTVNAKLENAMHVNEKLLHDSAILMDKRGDAGMLGITIGIMLWRNRKRNADSRGQTKVGPITCHS